ncbi:response regulator [uncultured Sphaerochaeta sp.]|uniref:response regulator transcription factor n=1 Tax=uncultured Sphaerochaeta sp. TaxID=886478 RepID=UPI002A0A9406|nr:response regulator [uncultured Sphaerochaeta sp.]
MGKYSVMIVEDEKQASEHICKIIQRRLLDFQVANIAENGQEALAIIKNEQPDVVVTDIHMPLMNGVELISHITEIYPEVLSIVISGYQDFDSVKGALTNGSLDYVLKPISPAKIEKAFSSLQKKLEKLYEEKQNQLLIQLSRNLPISIKNREKYFPEDSFYLAIKRSGSLPSRFFRTFSVSQVANIDKLMILSGRDDQESIYLIPTKHISYLQFKNLIKEQLHTETFSTIIFRKETFHLTQFYPTLMEMINFLDYTVTIGYSQEREYSSGFSAKFSFPPIQKLLDRAELYLRENRFADFKDDLSMTMREWGEAKRPQLWVENAIRELFRSTLKGSRNSNFDFNYNFMLDNIFQGTETLDELEHKILDLFAGIFRIEYGTFEKFDCPTFFQQVITYLKKHCTDKISMSDLCAIFGISQTHMNMLFKKYAQTTFIKYLLNTRMEKAIDLMKTSENLQIKDIAVLSGFNDQFYFSKLFHKEFGKTPSEYAQNKRLEGKTT